MLTLRIAFVTVLIGSTAALATGEEAKGTGCSDMSRFGEVSKEELTSLLDQKSVFVVDVNSAASFKKQKIPTAIHYGTTQKKFAKVLPADKSTLVVAYCGGPLCTAWQKAATKACELGYANVKHFKGGISGWVASATP